MKEIEGARRALIQKAALTAKDSYYRGDGIDDAEILLRRKLEMETLFVQSLGERSDEVREIVQGFVDGSSPAPHYLAFINNFNSPEMNLGTDSAIALYHLRGRVQLPRRVRPAETPPETTSPPRTSAELDHVTPQRPTTLTDAQDSEFHDVSFREGDEFGRYSPAAYREFVANTLAPRSHGPRE